MVIANLRGDAGGTANDNAPDFVGITGSVVWVHHVTAIGDGTSAMDGFVDVSVGGTDVTVSWCRVDNWDNVHLVRYGARMTMHHNYYSRCTGRLPKSDDKSTTGVSSMVHSYNNWIKDWTGSVASDAQNGGEIFVENNIYDSAISGKIAVRSATGGKWNGIGNILTNATTSGTPTTVFTPPYVYAVEIMDTSSKAQELRENLQAKTGWQHFSANRSPNIQSNPSAIPNPATMR